MKKTIKIERKAHYYLKVPKGKVKSLLIVIHGYGQRAQDFIEGFSDLGKSNILIVAPEGISKFYNRKNKAVASWMTAHERLDEIDDYCNYLTQLFKEVQENYSFEKIAVLGFSQGVSTALRWIAQQSYKTKITAYLCAGSIPPELKSNDFDKQKGLKLKFYYGNGDPLMSLSKAKAQIEALTALNVDFASYEYNGKHEVPHTCLEAIESDLT